MSREWYEGPLEAGWIPDAAVRFAIRRLCVQRVKEERAAGEARQKALIAAMGTGPLALETGAANEQHYEVPSEFFRLALGPRLKYSSCYWPAEVKSLAEAEELTLALTAERAGIANGQRVLELGCGWGSLSLWMAEKFPGASITAVSNSSSQKQFIDTEARRRGLRNLTVITSDMNRFEPEGELFDRIVSVEMFEHMRNWRLLLEKAASWTTPDARIFVHYFAHRDLMWPFEPGDGWMAKHFFTGGIMPSKDLIRAFPEHWRVVEDWTIPGDHYQRTLEAWLERLDRNWKDARSVFERVYGEGEGGRWVMRWRTFFMACSELFGYAGGNEWVVAHFLLEKRG